MPLYESTFIARQDLSRQDVTKLTDELAGIVAKEGGKVVKSEYWGLRPMAYTINKNSKGHYTMMSLDASADAVKELERIMHINENIVRTLTVRVEEIEKGPSAILRTSGTDEAPEFEPAFASDKAN